MAWVLGPTFNFEQVKFAFDDFAVKTVTALPPFVETLTQNQAQGQILTFTTAGQTHSLPIPMPRLPGLDELEIEQVSFDLSSAAFIDETTVTAQNVSTTGLRISYNPTSVNTPVSLTRLEIEDLQLPASAEKTYIVAGNGANGSVNHVVYRFDSERNRVSTEVNGSTEGAEYVHFLVQPITHNGLGPPLLAAPYFAMPGQGSALYGPALGGASLAVFNKNGTIKAVLILSTPLPVASCQLLLGTSANDSNQRHGGLPNEVGTIVWSATAVTAQYDVRPSGLSITASVPDHPDQPLIASFDTDPGNTPINIDFAPAARSLLNSAYPSALADDLGLQLNFSCVAPANIRVNLGNASARYIRRPLAGDTEERSIIGTPECVTLAIPQHLKPAGVSFTVDGSYGPARLIAAADNTPENISGSSRQGFRVANITQLARRITLTKAERQLTLARVALFGRASEAGELLITLHSGDGLRIGPALGDPVSLSLSATAQPSWQRAEFPIDKILPPYPEAVWVVAKVTRGVYWWHADTQNTTTTPVTQRSNDDGVSWNLIAEPIAKQLLLQLAVLEVDANTNPAPLQPVTLTWADGILNTDIVGIMDQEGPLAPQFRRHWLAREHQHQTFLDRIPQLNGLLSLSFYCRRDVDLALSNVVLVYNPWQAGDP